MESTCNQNSFDLKPIGLFLLIICAILSGIWLVYSITVPTTDSFVLEEYGTLTVEQIRILEVLSGHPWSRHKEQVNQAIHCLENNGPYKSFKTFGFWDDFLQAFIPTNVWVCKDKSGDFYALVTTTFRKMGQNQVARLVTGYKIGTDIFPTLDDYISYISLKWSAQVISYTIEAGKILLDPK